VRKVVPTLNSKSTEIYPSMAGAKQLGDTRFILVPAGTVRPAGMCSGHCIVLHRSASRGVLQVRRERRLVLQVPEVLIEASVDIGVKAEGMRVCVVRLCVRPLRLGDYPAFFRPRREQFTGVSRYSPTCEGMACSAMELMTVPGESCSCWGVVASPVPVQERLRGWLRGDCSSGRRPRADSRVLLTGGRTGHSSGRGDVPSPCALTTSGMSLQCPEWCSSGGDGRTGLIATEKTVPAGLTSRCSPV
jgi:hypothetical protein